MPIIFDQTAPTIDDAREALVQAAYTLANTMGVAATQIIVDWAVQDPRQGSFPGISVLCHPRAIAPKDKA